MLSKVSILGRVSLPRFVSGQAAETSLRGTRSGRALLGALAVVLFTLGAAAAQSDPLAVHPENRRYFVGADPGKALYLAGTQHWNNLQDFGTGYPPPPFDFLGTYPPAEAPEANFIRGWYWEHSRWQRDNGNNEWVLPLPFARTGPGTASDGRARFNLSTYDGTYVTRLRSRAQAAGSRGMVLSLMLFEGFSVQSLTANIGSFTYPNHPFRSDGGAQNNTQRFSGDWTTRFTEGGELHALPLKGDEDKEWEIKAGFQDNYVRQVVGSLNGYSNIFWEISNESHSQSLPWQEHVASVIRSEEASRLNRHLIWISHPQGVSNTALFASSADIISPTSHLPAVTADGGTVNGRLYETDPPATSGAKVVILDTDHLQPACSRCDSDWAWKAFTRGYHVMLLDGLDADFPDTSGRRALVRKAVGQTVRYSRLVNLLDMAPQLEGTTTPASTGYCLYSSDDPDPLPYHQAVPNGRELLALKPRPGSRVVLSGLATGSYEGEWFRLSNGSTAAVLPVTPTAGSLTLTSPWGDSSAALWLRRVDPPEVPSLEVLVEGLVRTRGSEVPFGETYIGQPVLREFVLRNSGTAMLQVQNVRLRSAPGFTLTGPTSFNLGVGGTRTLTVTLAAASADNFGGFFEVTSNDPGGLYSLSLTGSVIQPGSCTPSATTLCLQDNRFSVSATYFNHHNGQSGTGNKIDYSGTTGLFWFFSSQNIELLVKVIDGRPNNGSWWFFYGGLTDVAVTLTVRDEHTGQVATYQKTAQNLCGGADTRAFPDGATATVPQAFEGGGQWLALPAEVAEGAGVAGTCVAGSTNLCLLNSRFELEVDFAHPTAGIRPGMAIPFNDRTGFFWFFNSVNLELPIKVLDGTPNNNHYWVFFGSLTNVSYTVRVTDTVTGATQSYSSGQAFCGLSDTTAFPGP